MKNKEKSSNRKVWLKEKSEKVLTQLISDLAMVQPENIMQFIYEWALRHLKAVQIKPPKIAPKIEVKDKIRFHQKKFPTQIPTITTLDNIKSVEATTLQSNNFQRKFYINKANVCLPEKSDKLSSFNMTRDSTFQLGRDSSQSEVDLQSRPPTRPQSAVHNRLDYKTASKDKKMRRVFEASEPKIRANLDIIASHEKMKINIDSMPNMLSDVGSSDRPDKRPKSVTMRIRRPLSEESINLHENHAQSSNNIHSHSDLKQKNLEDIYNQDINIRTMAIAANQSLNEQKQMMENMGEKDELELTLKKAFNHYDQNSVGYQDFDAVKNLFGDASNELNVDLFDNQELKDLYDSVPSKVQGKVSFDCLFNIVGPLLEQKLID